MLIISFGNIENEDNLYKKNDVKWETISFWDWTAWNIEKEDNNSRGK